MDIKPKITLEDFNKLKTNKEIELTIVGDGEMKEEVLK